MGSINGIKEGGSRVPGEGEYLIFRMHLQEAGGPTIPMRFGRKDAPGPESVQPEGNLPGDIHIYWFVSTIESLPVAQQASNELGLLAVVCSKSSDNLTTFRAYGAWFDPACGCSWRCSMAKR